MRKAQGKEVAAYVGKLLSLEELAIITPRYLVDEYRDKHGARCRARLRIVTDGVFGTVRVVSLLPAEYLVEFDDGRWEWLKAGERNYARGDGLDSVEPVL